MLTAASVPGQVNVTKSGSKLGITIPQLTESGNPARTVIRLTVANQSGQASFLALAAPWVTIPTKICTKLNIAYDQTISILELKQIQPHSRPPFRTEGDKADMLSLIPPTSINGHLLYVDEYRENGEEWLRIWYYHPRGAARQIELRRYVNISKLGQLLGLLQAEGDKKSPRVAFKNASLSEHADFVSALRELGTPPSNIMARCVFNPAKSSQESATEYSKLYTMQTGIIVSSFNENTAMKGAMVAETCVRSSILATVLTSAMDETRKGSIPHEGLRQSFIAKLLSGDGTLDARSTPSRLDVRVKIVDQNLNYLSDYATLLAREGFKAKILPAKISVRAYCTWLNLLYLYQINAFRNNKNWVKLICSIIIQREGMENKGYKRIQDLANRHTITSDELSAIYSIGRRSANLWIGRMQRLGLMRPLPREPGNPYKIYSVTTKGKEVSKTLDAVEGEYNRVSLGRGIDDAANVLAQLKAKHRPGSNQNQVAIRNS